MFRSAAGGAAVAPPSAEALARAASLLATATPVNSLTEQLAVNPTVTVCAVEVARGRGGFIDARTFCFVLAVDRLLSTPGGTVSFQRVSSRVPTIGVKRAVEE